MYIGLDFSTQQLKLTTLTEDFQVPYEDVIHFDNELPHYRTKGGVHTNGLTVTAPTLMWVEALDKLLDKLAQKQFPFAQQHGSVYWAKGASKVLASVKPSLPLHEQLKDVFIVKDSPIWQDSSTAEECRKLENAVGGPENLARITGSAGYERFTGPQIAKIARTRPQQYAQCERISLVSSFAATLLTLNGRYAPIDTSDGSGMNLMDVETKKWDSRLLEACAPGLAERLGEVAESDRCIVGTIGSYFIERYCFSKATLASIISPKEANESGSDLIVSLGTSDTLFLTLKDPSNLRPEGGAEGHILSHPTDRSAFMAMLCYKNGSLTRESIRNQYAGGSWHEFNRMVAETPAGCDGKIGFFFVVPEILPRCQGTWRFENGMQVQDFSGRISCETRCVLESQFLSMYIYARRLGLRIPEHVNKIIATGGASANTAILGVLADVLGAPVYVMDGADGGSFGASAAMGGALRAWYCAETEGRKRGQASADSSEVISFEQFLGQMVEKAETEGPGTRQVPRLRLIATADKKRHGVYMKMVEEYVRLQVKVCELGKF
ncbi:hypothetical protein HK102_005886 [Quaeritorhiza haematococci]|nr:hypothetical protein HK102_005886 [Quaeritorhiza haematococci]